MDLKENDEAEMLSNSESFGDDDCFISQSVDPSCNSSVENPNQEDAVEDEACTSWADISSFFTHSQLKEYRERRNSRYQEASLLKKLRGKNGEGRRCYGFASVNGTFLFSAPLEVSSDGFLAFKPTSSTSATFEWCCNKCAAKDREVHYETEFLLCARLHALYHMFMEHNNERERLLAETEKRKIEQEIGVLLEFRIRTQKDIEGLKCFADEIVALSIDDYRLISAVLQSAQGEVDAGSNVYLRVCFCYKTFADYTQLCAHLRCEHDFVFRYTESFDFYPISERSFCGKSLLAVSLAPSGKWFAWKCFACAWNDKRQSEIVLRLMVVYHLRSVHHKDVRAMCIASNEKWFLEKKLAVELKFTPPTENEISTMLRTSGAEIAKRLQLTDERILTAIRNSTVGVIKSNDVPIVCFCYRTFKKYFSYETHLRNVHSIVIPRHKNMRMKKARDLKPPGRRQVTINAICRVKQSKKIAIKSRSSKQTSIKHLDGLSVLDDTYGSDIEQQSRALIASNYRELLGGGFCVGSSKVRGKRTHRYTERFFWKCALCSEGDMILSNDDCILYSELGAVLSLWAHLQERHSMCSGLSDSLWHVRIGLTVLYCYRKSLILKEIPSMCIIAAENNFLPTPPCLKVIEEEPSPHKRSFGSTACFKCDHFPTFYINDEFSLIIHLLQIHMAYVDNEVLSFLDGRKDMQHSFPYLSTTHDDYFTTRLTCMFLHCSKCEFKCIYVEKLVEHAMWHYHNPYYEGAENLLTHSDNSIINRFAVEEPILEYTIAKSYKPKQPLRRRQSCVRRICRQCFSLMECLDEMHILEHYYKNHLNQLVEIRNLYCLRS